MSTAANEQSAPNGDVLQAESFASSQQPHVASTATDERADRQSISNPDAGMTPRQPYPADADGGSGATGQTGSRNENLTTRDDSDAEEVALVANGGSFRARWESVQVGFVDDPRQAVEEAEQLLTVVIDELVDGFRQQRSRLEDTWNAQGDPSTDELRLAFQRYRMFFERLLAA
jgi:hypothetical protein